MSDLANSKARVGVDTFSALSGPSSSRTLFFVEICSLADVGEMSGGFRFRRVGLDKVAGETSRSVSRASPGARNESRAFGHVVGVA